MKNLLLGVLALLPFFVHCEEKESKDVKQQLAQLITDHNQFAISLYSQLNTDDSNVIFSPYSIATCMGMTYVGAREDTAQEMLTALQLNLSPKEIAAPSALLNEMLMPSDNQGKNYELTLANSMWLDIKKFVLSDFRYAMEQQFKAKIGVVNFAEPDQALSMINNWIADKTHDHIKNLFLQGDITSSTALVLANAAYFKGTFINAFNVKMTQEGSFHPTLDTTATVNMMEQTAFLPFLDKELIQAVALPFNGRTKGGGNLALLILLPKSAENFSEVVNTASDSFPEWVSSLQQQRVHVKLPKFILSKRYDLGKPLQELGMQVPFTTQANFSGIDGLMDLYLSKVVHEAYFALDEFGVTAAAATGAAFNLTAVPNKEPPAELIADHPFLFFIVDLKSKEVLFMGKFAEPSNAL